MAHPHVSRADPIGADQIEADRQSPELVLGAVPVRLDCRRLPLRVGVQYQSEPGGLVTVQGGAGAGIHGLPSNSRRKAAKGLTPCLRAVAT